MFPTVRVTLGVPTGDNSLRLAFDILVTAVCSLSLVLCARSIARGILLQRVSSRGNIYGIWEEFRGFKGFMESMGSMGWDWPDL